MIRNFRHRGLKQLFNTGSSKRIGQRFKARALRRLDALNQAITPDELNIPGFDYHKLENTNPVRYSIHVNGNYCITFGWDGDNAIDVDFEDYH